jgi:hypothetical protein
MPEAIPNPIQEPATATNGHRHPSLDFRGQIELDWPAIEEQIHAIGRRAKAVEMVGRTAQDDVHGETLVDVFAFLAEDISADLERLTVLLGLGNAKVRSS